LPGAIVPTSRVFRQAAKPQRSHAELRRNSVRSRIPNRNLRWDRTRWRQGNR